jgi:hypothetical protein
MCIPRIVFPMSIPFSHTQKVRLHVHVVYLFIPFHTLIACTARPQTQRRISYLSPYSSLCMPFCVSKLIIHSLYILHSFTPVPFPFPFILSILSIYVPSIFSIPSIYVPFCSIPALPPVPSPFFSSSSLSPPSMFPSVPSLHLPQSLLLFSPHLLYPLHLCSLLFHPCTSLSPFSFFLLIFSIPSIYVPSLHPLYPLHLCSLLFHPCTSPSPFSLLPSSSLSSLSMFPPSSLSPPSMFPSIFSIYVFPLILRKYHTDSFIINERCTSL